MDITAMQPDITAMQPDDIHMKVLKTHLCCMQQYSSRNHEGMSGCSRDSHGASCDLEVADREESIGCTCCHRAASPSVPAP